MPAIEGIVTRRMSQAEYVAFGYALFLTHVIRDDADRLSDRLCELANNSEAASIRYEQRGMHAEAAEALLVAEAYDAAANGLVR